MTRWAEYPEVQLPPAEPTLFEQQVADLGLAQTPEAWPDSAPLRRFAKAYRSQRYIPEWLLIHWGLELRNCDLDKVTFEGRYFL